MSWFIFSYKSQKCPATVYLTVLSCLRSCIYATIESVCSELFMFGGKLLLAISCFATTYVSVF